MTTRHHKSSADDPPSRDRQREWIKGMLGSFPTTLVFRAAIGLSLSCTADPTAARDSLGLAVDNTCSAFNGTKPYAASGEAPARCLLCHGANLALHNPEWAWTMGGSSGQRNFCVVQGIISLPNASAAPPDLVVEPGGTIDLAARGFSPTGGAGAVTFVWRLSDRATTLTGATQSGVPMPNAGTITITLETTDAGGARDQTPEQRTVLVTRTPLSAQPDHYATRPGRKLSVAAPGILSNDSGPGSLSATLARNVSDGRLTLSPDGGFEYRPRRKFIGVDSFDYAIGSGSAVTSTTVTISVGACLDSDKDGYSGEGSSCGPRDCSDTDRAIHPGATEICGDGVDNDCNGLADAADAACNGQDCIGQLLGEQVPIRLAKWTRKTGTLTVSGGRAPVGANVIVANARTGKSLGTTLVDESGRWSFERVGLKRAPCRIRVEIAAKNGESAIRNAPASCGPTGAPPSCPAAE